MFVYIIFLSLIPVSQSTIGIDVSQSVSQEQFQCLKDNGYRFVIVRAYRKVGVVDWRVAQTIRNARSVGLKTVDAYFLPCISCDDPAQQIIETMEYLKDESVEIDRLWIDIEGTWDNRTDSNIQFLDGLIQQIQQYQVKFGIFTSRSYWMEIMNDISRFSLLTPLWYPNDDNQKSFDDFQAFGGWQQASLKQYRSDVKECGVVLDKNFA